MGRRKGYSKEARANAAIARKIKNQLGNAAYEQFKKTGQIPAGLDKQEAPKSKKPAAKKSTKPKKVGTQSKKAATLDTKDINTIEESLVLVQDRDRIVKSLKTDGGETLSDEDFQTVYKALAKLNNQNLFTPRAEKAQKAAHAVQEALTARGARSSPNDRTLERQKDDEGKDAVDRVLDTLPENLHVTDDEKKRLEAVTENTLAAGGTEADAKAAAVEKLKKNRDSSTTAAKGPPSKDPGLRKRKMSETEIKAASLPEKKPKSGAERQRELDKLASEGKNVPAAQSGGGKAKQKELDEKSKERKPTRDDESIREEMLEQSRILNRVDKESAEYKSAGVKLEELRSQLSTNQPKPEPTEEFTVHLEPRPDVAHVTARTVKVKGHSQKDAEERALSTEGEDFQVRPRRRHLSQDTPRTPEEQQRKDGVDEMSLRVAITNARSGGPGFVHKTPYGDVEFTADDAGYMARIDNEEDDVLVDQTYHGLAEQVHEELISRPRKDDLAKESASPEARRMSKQGKPTKAGTTLAPSDVEESTEFGDSGFSVEVLKIDKLDDLKPPDMDEKQWESTRATVFNGLQALAEAQPVPDQGGPENVDPNLKVDFSVAADMRKLADQLKGIDPNKWGAFFQTEHDKLDTDVEGEPGGLQGNLHNELIETAQALGAFPDELSEDELFDQEPGSTSDAPTEIDHPEWTDLDYADQLHAWATGEAPPIEDVEAEVTRLLEQFPGSETIKNEASILGVDLPKAPSERSANSDLDKIAENQGLPKTKVLETSLSKIPEGGSLKVGGKGDVQVSITKWGPMVSWQGTVIGAGIKGETDNLSNAARVALDHATGESDRRTKAAVDRHRETETHLTSAAERAGLDPNEVSAEFSIFPVEGPDKELNANLDQAQSLADVKSALSKYARSLPTGDSSRQAAQDLSKQLTKLDERKRGRVDTSFVDHRSGEVIEMATMNPGELMSLASDIEGGSISPEANAPHPVDFLENMPDAKIREWAVTASPREREDFLADADFFGPEKAAQIVSEESGASSTPEPETGPNVSDQTAPMDPGVIQGLSQAGVKINPTNREEIMKIYNDNLADPIKMFQLLRKFM